MRAGRAPQELLEAIDDEAWRLLVRFQVAAPPVDAVRLARQMGVQRCARGRSGPASRRPLPGSRAVPDDPAGAKGVQDQLQAAGAIGRRLLPRLLVHTRLGSAGRSGDAELRLAWLFATRLLVPTCWFRDDVRRLRCDLVRLGQRYATVSTELLAWRLLDLEDPMVVSIFDNNHLVERRANVAGVPEAPAPAELAAQAYAHTYSRPHAEHGRGITARAWPVHRADWRREVVVSLIDRDSAEWAE